MYRVNGSYLEDICPQGWQCPVCKRVYSPTTFMCCYCGANGTTISTTGTTISTTGTTTTVTSGYVDTEEDNQTKESKLSERIKEIVENFNKEMGKHL